jgi:glycosyltransferase involved in cell wall biosynthesis
VQPGYFQQLRQAIETLLTDPKLAARLGQTGWQTVQDNYSAEIVTRKYINVFRQVTSAAEATVLPVDCS